MFGHLFALILLFLILEGGSVTTPIELSFSLFQSVLISLIGYLLILTFFHFLKRAHLKKFHSFIVQGLLLLFVYLSLNILGLERLFSFFPAGQKVLSSVLFIFLYFIGLAVGIHTILLRFLLPFAFPFILYLLLISSLQFLSLNTALVLFFALMVMSSLLLFPFLFRALWNCQPIPPSPLKTLIETFCKNLHFSIGGLYIWMGMRGTATAAFVGIMPKLRYLLYTEALLKLCTDKEIEAITAHEWGHHKKMHLLLYPFLLAGAYPLIHFISKMTPHLPPFFIFILYGGILFLFVRYVFGFFSRQCEKEADLQALKVGIDPELLISALEKVGRYHHVSLKKFHWHHGSIQERIDLIKRVYMHPSYGKRYEKFCFFSRVSYFTLIALLSYLLW